MREKHMHVFVYIPVERENHTRLGTHGSRVITLYFEFVFRLLFKR